MPGKVRPFRQFVLKICSRCDLACDHCYVYEYADQSWRGRPLAIASETLTRRLGKRPVNRDRIVSEIDRARNVHAGRGPRAPDLRVALQALGRRGGPCG